MNVRLRETFADAVTRLLQQRTLVKLWHKRSQEEEARGD